MVLTLADFPLISVVYSPDQHSPPLDVDEQLVINDGRCEACCLLLVIHCLASRLSIVRLAERAVFVVLRVTRVFSGFFLTGLGNFSGLMKTGSFFATVGVPVVSFTSGDGRAGAFEACFTGSVMNRSVAGASALSGAPGSTDAAGSNGSFGSAGMSGTAIVFGDGGAGTVAVFVSATGGFSLVGSAGSALSGRADSAGAAGSAGSIGLAGISSIAVVFGDGGAGVVAVFVSATGGFSLVGSAGLVMTGGAVFSALTGIDSGVISLGAGAVSVVILSVFVCWGLTGCAASMAGV